MYARLPRTLAFAAVAVVVLAAATACGGGSATRTGTPTGTALAPAATATSEATPPASPSASVASSTPSATSSATPSVTPTPLPGVAVISAANAAHLAPAASAQISGFSRSAWTAHGTEFRVVTQNGLVEIDTVAGTASKPIDLSDQGFLIGIAPDGHTLAFATTSGVRIWDLDTGQDVATLDAGANARTTISQAIFTPDARTVALVHQDKIDVTLWDVASGRQLEDLSGFNTAAPVYTVRMNADASELAWVSRATVQFANVQSGNLGPRLSFEQFVATSQFLPDGRFLTVVPGSDAQGQSVMTVSTWDPVSGQQQSTFDMPSLSASASVSPDGSLLAAATNDAVTVWDLGSGKRVASVATNGVPVRLVSFAPDGRTLAAMLDNGTLQFLRVPSGS